MDVDAIRAELLHSGDDWMKRRRTISMIATLLAGHFGLLGMRQYGVIRHLPDPPIRGFDADAITTSRPAYPFGIPDSAFAVIGAGAVIALATANGTARSGRTRWHDLALGAAVAGGGVASIVYLAQMVRQRKVCAYCIAGSSGFLSLAALAWRGVVRALRTT